MDAGTSIDGGVLLDALAGLFFLSGALLAFAAGVGLVRFPDLLARMHSATKPQVLGLILALIGLALRLRSGDVLWMLVLIVLFQLLTSPVASHMVGRAGYRTGKVRSDLLVVDDLTADQDAAEREAHAEDRLAAQLAREADEATGGRG
ncbi:monovalent cation/H(+) antiporter subunit G [Cellulomonas fimi]|uniref:Monovalent cation/H(+) antiporter subunit G n=1 Tax=Cellulomonas fimi TaxID=1708 RepID=A0A7Y0QHN3_CELFI|nr:monovalent cation/H(+) antiporter subunit G [Cellulomonas fimi]NMR20069.1 monovalent cation/H(+) antiporter subunit G [Cellulomonas fimi]